MEAQEYTKRFKVDAEILSERVERPQTATAALMMDDITPLSAQKRREIEEWFGTLLQRHSIVGEPGRYLMGGDDVPRFEMDKERLRALGGPFEVCEPPEVKVWTPWESQYQTELETYPTGGKPMKYDSEAHELQDTIEELNLGLEKLHLKERIQHIRDEIAVAEFRASLRNAPTTR